MNSLLKIMGETAITGGVRRRSAKSGMRLLSRFNVEGAMLCAESARWRVFGQPVEARYRWAFCDNFVSHFQSRFFSAAAQNKIQIFPCRCLERFLISSRWQGEKAVM
jgi:hypothetical protein